MAATASRLRPFRATASCFAAIEPPDALVIVAQCRGAVDRVALHL